MGSTNDLCRETKLNKDFLVISADKQTKGRGRQGKKWSSPSGNISFSIAFEYNKPEMPISLIAGVIAQSSISKALRANNIKLKWPNDLIYKNKKIGGILVENDEIGKKTKTVVGIGINLALEEKEPWWGDLSSFNSINTRDNILNNMIKGFYAFIDDELNDWKRLWEENCAHTNKRIKIIHNNKIIDEGIFSGINEKGALIIDSGGDLKEYKYGEISIEGIY